MQGKSLIGYIGSIKSYYRHCPINSLETYISERTFALHSKQCISEKRANVCPGEPLGKSKVFKVLRALS